MTQTKHGIIYENEDDDIQYGGAKTEFGPVSVRGPLVCERLYNTCES
jgi:hypothetical protein